MTRDDVFKLANEAGFNWPEVQTTTIEQRLERFASLVAQQEREECAKVAEGFEQNRDWVRGSLYESIRNEVAARIRARGAQRCPECRYQHGHAIGCVNNPVDIAIRSRGAK